MAAPGARSDASQPLTLAQLLDLHPWPAAHAKDKRIERLWTFDLPGPPEQIWPHVADTSRMNRALGLAEMTFEERDGKRRGTSKSGGVRHEWLEVPWNWVANQWLTCTRLYDRGFSKVVYAIHRVEAIPTGTRLYLYFGAIPRGAFGAAALRLGFPTIERAYRRVVPALAAQLDRLRPDVLQLPPPQLSEQAEQRLRRQRESLVAEGLPHPVVDALLDWIRTGDDPDLHRIQVRERARVWKVPEEDLLKVALHATRAGVLTLSWDTVCPHCRGVRDENATLSQLQAESHCSSCQVDFTTDKPEAVEVTFRVHPSVREVPDQLYCSAEPSKKEHIRVQYTLPPGARVSLSPRLEPGRYTVWADHDGGWYVDVDDAATTRSITWKPHPEGHVEHAAPDASIQNRRASANVKNRPL